MKNITLKFLITINSFLNHIITLGIRDGFKLYFFKPTKDKEYCVNLKCTNHPFFIRGNTSDNSVIEQVFYQKQYDISLGFEPKTILDCGANIGLASIFFKTKYPNSTIIAIEPENSNFDLLTKNLIPYSNFHAEKKGLWSESCFLEIIEGEDKLPWSFYVKPTTIKSDKTIEAISVFEIIEKYNLKEIDILKIDIEGAEENLFEKNVEKWLPIVKVIIIELHDQHMPLSSRTFFNVLSKNNFSIYFMGENIIATQIDK